MSRVLVAQLVTAAAYAGFQWTVQVLVYRQFAAVPADAFIAYERGHQRLTGRLVAPLFGGLVLSTAALLVWRPAGVPAWAAALSAFLLLVILAVTAFGAVPLHRRLDSRWDPGTHHRLLEVDAVRVAAATANLVLTVGIAVR